MRAALVSVSLFLALASLANAELVEFVVDPALTRWNVSGAYFRNGLDRGDFEEQSPGSMVTSLAGFIRVDLTPTTIQFLPSTVLDAVPQPLPQQPGPNGAAGAAPADYGMAAPALPAPVPFFAVRDFAFSLSGPVLPLGPGGTQFGRPLNTDAIVNARIDFNLGTSAGTHTLANWARGLDDDVSAGNLITEGLTQRIEFANFFGEIFALESPSDLFIQWSGPIVATRIIPEPHSLILAVAIGAVELIAFRRKFLRRSIRPVAGFRETVDECRPGGI
jgi:hypothetical protein